MSFESKVRALVAADPGLPNPNPTTAFWQMPMHDTVGTIQSSSLPAETDVVVIGSGITGTSVTKALLEDEASFPGLKVTVLEARTLCSGATGRNGGHCVTAAGHKFTTWVDTYGVENARAIARFSLLNMERVQEVANGMTETIRKRSEIRRVQKLCFTSDPVIWKKIQDSVAMFAREIPEHASHNRLVSAEELSKEWGVVNPLGGYAQPAGAIWPYRFCTEVMAELLRRYESRLNIETRTPVTSVVDHGANASGHRYTVSTPRGAIKARRVVYCTNAYSAHLLPQLRGKLHPFRGHMSTQAMPERFPSWGGERSWSFIQPIRIDPTTDMYHFGLYYLQQNAVTKDLFVGVENQRIDECLGSDDSFVSEASVKDLPNCLPRMFSVLNKKGDVNSAADFDKPRLKCIWSGVMGMTSDGLPLVGQLPKSATGRASVGEEWIAAGFQGYGMDKCWMTGEALVAMMAGKDVSSWFPSAYLVSDKRITEDLSIEKTADAYVQMAAATVPEPVKARL